MNYCMHYNRHSKNMDSVDELIIQYNPNNDTLLDFLDKYKDKQRINMHVGASDNFKLFKELCDKYPNLAIVFNEYNENYLNNDFPFYFLEYVNNWDNFIKMINAKVSDVYIVSSLAFDIKAVAAAAKQNNIRIRMFPDVAQSDWDKLLDLKKFFIRPEDVELYEPYIDVLEFYEKKTQDIKYKIYTVDKKWFGDLSELISSFDLNLDNKYVIPRFGEHRLDCKKDCIRGGNCKICERIEELSHTLKEAGLIVRMDKDKEENNGN